MTKTTSELALEPLLSPVREIARQASQRILEIYESDFSVAAKQDSSPLTEADLAAHRAICDGLKALTPEVPILSEESSKISYEERSTWRRYWLVDPLDGTKEFVKRNGEFTVNIALVEDHEVVLGVVHVPVSDTAFYAARGVGAFKSINGEGSHATQLRTRRVDPEKIVVSGSRSHGGEALQAFTRSLPGEVKLISKGSSLKLCLVAEGLADIYPRLGPTSEWDTAAAQCVVEQAGGTVTNLQFEPLRYNAKADILNPHFLVIGDRSFGWEKLVRGALGSQ